MNTQKCPILTANEYQRGFNANLTFKDIPFINNTINWKPKGNSKLTFAGFNDEQEVEFIGTDKEWKEQELRDNL